MFNRNRTIYCKNPQVAELVKAYAKKLNRAENLAAEIAEAQKPVVQQAIAQQVPIHDTQQPSARPQKIEVVTLETVFAAGMQDWSFPEQILEVALKFWTADEIREIERHYSCNNYTQPVSLGQLLQRFPPQSTLANE